MNDLENAVLQMMAECEELRSEGKCPGCAEPVVHEFKDDLSRREFEISGFCQQCQDDVFSEPED